MYIHQLELARYFRILDLPTFIEPNIVKVTPLQTLGLSYLSATELFYKVGLDIKSASTYPYTFVVEPANRCVGYMPTEEGYGSKKSAQDEIKPYRN